MDEKSMGKNEVTNETTNLHHPSSPSFNTPALRAAIGSVAAHAGLDVHVSHPPAGAGAVADGRQRLSCTRAVADEKAISRHRPLRRELRRAHGESLGRETHSNRRH